MRSSNRIRILLVDDHIVVRAGYRRFLEQEPDCQVIAEASSGEEAYQVLQTIEPDIVILDLSMPGQGGLSGGYSTSDNCAVREKVPEMAQLNPFCHIETSFLPQYKALASYVIPKIDVSLSGTLTKVSTIPP